MSYLPAPLHRTHVKTSLASKNFPVAVRPCFPIDGVPFIMGNDIAGGKVYPRWNWRLCPCLSDVLANTFPDKFPVGVVSRAQAL